MISDKLTGQNTKHFFRRPFDRFLVIAGPCTVDSKDQLEETAAKLSQIGVSHLRAGAFKMRTSPDSYQGLGEEGLQYLQDAGSRYNLETVSEIISVADIDLMCQYVDILLVGTRNMQNYPLLKALGMINKPVILKRGMANSIREWIQASEYIKKGGNDNIIMCERGIRTFEDYTRNSLDLSAVPIVKSLTPYPVIVDPSHATGRAELVKPMTWAAAAAGADGVMIECDADPLNMKCDSKQTITIEELQSILEKLPSITNIWR